MTGTDRREMVDLHLIKNTKTLIEFVFCWMIYPAMSSGVGQSLERRLNSSVAVAIDQVRQLESTISVADADNEAMTLKTLSNWALDTLDSPLTQLLRNRFLVDLYTGLLDAAYGPRNLINKIDYEQLFRRLFASVKPMENLEILLALMKSGGPRWFTRAVSRYLNIVITSKDGDNDEDKEVPQNVLDNIARLLLVLPERLNAKLHYIHAVMIQLVDIVAVSSTLLFTTQTSSHSTNVARPIERAAAYLLARSVDTWSNDGLNLLKTTVLAPLYTTDDSKDTTGTSKEEKEMALIKAAYVLHQLLVNGEPSPERYDTLITPCLIRLYILWCITTQKHLSLQSLVNDLMTVYFRVMDESTALFQLRQLVFLEKGKLSFTFGPHDYPILLYGVQNTPKPRNPLIQVMDVDESEDMNVQYSIEEFLTEEWIITFVEALDNEVISGGLAALLLQEYHTLITATADKDSANHIVKAVNLLLLLVDRLGTAIVKQPHQIIQLAIQILDNQEIVQVSNESTTPSILNIVTENKEVDSGETEEALELASITLTLVNTVVTEHHGLPTSCRQLVNPLMAVLKRLTQHPSQFMADLADSLWHQLQQDTANKDSTQSTETRSREQYEEALRSLQDKVLPVRAYGMVTLRNMILAKDPLFDDPTLLENTLHLFISMVQDDDSFIYLNAIKGLSSLADVHGRQVVRLLTAAYLDSRANLDHRLRIGEVLLQTIKRYGTALGLHAETLVRSLLYVLQRDAAIEMRHSALSILGVMCETYPLSFLSYLDDLIDWSMNALKLESALELRRAAAGLFVFLFRGLGSDLVGQVSLTQIRSVYEHFA
ncbi:hypothetical protein BDF19DRAFT_413418 [Syncephalis fuscata]|nr:hypothetical protein BDF19DRAFT_413418 [Syncephalis fuscata]